jgi:hypothetical protein
VIVAVNLRHSLVNVCTFYFEKSDKYFLIAGGCPLFFHLITRYKTYGESVQQQICIAELIEDRSCYHIKVTILEGKREHRRSNHSLANTTVCVRATEANRKIYHFAVLLIFN